MLYSIKNEFLSVQICDKGAEMWSIKDKEGSEYLWQGDASYWGDRSPNLFPYIARLTEGKYTLHGKTYEMDIHGFAKDTVFNVERISEEQLVFSIINTGETYAVYPYQFKFSVIYKLEGRKICVHYQVENHDEKEMYFGLGGHPGFLVPFEEGTNFEDHYLEFTSVSEAKQVVFTEDCFVTDELRTFPLEEGVRLPLHHDLFDDDAIILTDMAKEICLKSKKGNKSIVVSYPDMDYLGLWHMPRTDAPYICIEPWTSLPSRKGVIEELSTQPGLVSLEASGKYENGFVIEISFRNG